MPHGFPVMMFGLGANALRLQCMPEVHVQVGVVRVLLQHLAEQFDGLSGRALADEDARQRAPMHELVRLSPHQDFELSRARACWAGQQQRSHQVLARRVVGRILRHHFFQTMAASREKPLRCATRTS